MKYSYFPDDLQNYLAVFKKLGQPTYEALILDHGRHFHHRVTLDPKHVKEFSMECYNNAWKFKQRRKSLRYCEGFVGLETCPIPIMHGWCIDDEDHIYDPSVNQSHGAVYYGVVFKEEFASTCWKELRRMQAIGIFGNWWLLRKISMQNLIEGIDK